ncbi:MAG TPA: VWA domain-containing protein [Marinobacter antarcticus]|uniref:VWA domain-containing protein n=3 Tax=root TaxID=1 RepID=A0A831R5K4_9GAMM|nr:VWA domain-containing protein [Marinobacter antarcticus]
MFPRVTMPRFLTLVFLAALLLPTTLWAEETTKLTLPESPDIRIIVDISGSMKETDPNNLRQPAVRLLARVLPEGSTAGVWTFGQYVNMLVPHGEVNEGWRETAINRSGKINSVALRTNLGKAIETASDDYVTGGTLENTHFILLTDGKVDISDSDDVNRAEEKRIVSKVLEPLVARGATFHTVALSDQADAGFLKTLADKSKGSFRTADTAEALNLAFLGALNTAAPQEQIPIEGNAFTVDAGVKEFTALIFRGSAKTGEAAESAGLEMIGPDGKALAQSSAPDNVRWAREAAYDLVTITEPQSGEWRVKGALGEGSQVTVVSDLRMVVSQIPPTFTPESPINVRVGFFEKADRITSPEFLDVLSVKLSLMSEDGSSGSKTLSVDSSPEEGEYSDTISKLPAEGVYRIDIVADGKTFARKFTATTEFILPVGMIEPAIGAPIDISLAEQSGQALPPEPEPEIQPEPQSEPEPQPQPEPKTQPAPVKPADPAPAVEAEPVDEPSVESALPFPLWMIGAGAGALVVLALILILLMRNRRASPDAADAAGEDPESLEDLQQEMADIEAEVPVVMAEEEPAEEDIPTATAVVEPEEEIPELVEPVNEDDDEEFGLDEFELSEFDDLPSEHEPENEPDDKPKK